MARPREGQFTPSPKAAQRGHNRQSIPSAAIPTDGIPPPGHSSARTEPCTALRFTAAPTTPEHFLAAPKPAKSPTSKFFVISIRAPSLVRTLFSHLLRLPLL